MREIVHACYGAEAGEQVHCWLGSLWGKSARFAGGTTNLLIAHMLDTAAVADLIWDQYLSARFKHRLHRSLGPRARELFMLLCAVHDLGKATPAFQSVDATEAARPRQAGLEWEPARIRREFWRHDRVGAVLMRERTADLWPAGTVEWMWPLIAGHHGRFPVLAGLKPTSAKSKERYAHYLGAGEEWEGAQRALVSVAAHAIGFDDLAAEAVPSAPAKADQLTLSGLMVMADWIASDERYFPGVDDLDQVSLRNSRERASRAWEQLGLRGGWGRLPVPDHGVDLVKQRFGDHSRPLQRLLASLAHDVPAPALFVVEAPMGDGKTKAALALAEIIAARFGCDGVFVAMPTQATCDPVYDQVLEWVESFDPALRDQVALLHGKHRFNPAWRAVWDRPGEGAAGDSFGSVGEDEHLCGASPAEREAVAGPPSWFLGSKRGLLTAFGVGTIDQLLYAATRTSHVMLRFAGLAGKVVIVDEVHAADVYMRQFLLEALRWLGQAGVPVVLLSATLPPAQRQELCAAYASGIEGQRSTLQVPQPSGYPCVTVIGDEGGGAACCSAAAESWRASAPVEIEVLPASLNSVERIVERLRVELVDGGTALVVVNTVKRAQAIYAALERGFDAVVLLLHGRLDDGDRAERTGECLAAAKVGAARDPARRQVIVATQIAESSFDIDADVLVTDIAPIDLLLQRIGRLHRAVDTPRPARLRRPRVFVAGLAWRGRTPVFEAGSEYVYGRHLLLRTAALLTAADGSVPTSPAVWSLPEQIPELVAAAYSDAAVCPPAWSDMAGAVRIAWQHAEEARAASAAKFRLTGPDGWAEPTLAGLHYNGLLSAADETELAAVVRDGDTSAEVVLVRRDAHGYMTVDGTRLGVDGAPDGDVLERLLAGGVRLPATFTAAVAAALTGLPGWAGHPWLGPAKALVFDADGVARLAGRTLTYDPEFGLREQ